MTLQTPAGLAHDAPPALSFEVLSGGPLDHAAAPTLRFELAVRADGDAAVRSLMLEVQIRIALRRRAYDPETRERLRQVLGDAETAARAPAALPWTRTTLLVGPFTGATTVQLDVPCTYDFDVASAKFLDAVRDGEIPLELLFSGTIFYAAPDGRLQITRIPWDAEATFRLPASAWRETMDRFFPGMGWLRLRSETLDRLGAFKAANALPTWDATIAALLEGDA